MSNAAAAAGLRRVGRTVRLTGFDQVKNGGMEVRKGGERESWSDREPRSMNL